MTHFCLWEANFWKKGNESLGWKIHGLSLRMFQMGHDWRHRLASHNTGSTGTWHLLARLPTWLQGKAGRGRYLFFGESLSLKACDLKEVPQLLPAGF